MQLNDLKPAWNQFKFSNALHDLDTHEVLSIIAEPEPSSTHPYRMLIKAVVFLVITFFCVGG